MELIRGKSGPQVWLDATRYLRGNPSHQDFDLILHIADPVGLSVADRAVMNRTDAFLKGHGAGSLNTVAETIFPLQDYLRGKREGVFEIYPERMKRIHAVRSDKRWGCYAMRILRQKDRDGKVYNPLKELLEKLERMPQFKASFELGLGHPQDEEPAGDDIAIYEGATDRKRPYGGPCLSHLSVKVDDGKIRLNATYRSHYYMQRTLGNIMGLGRLLYFLSHETGMGIGPLTINSTYARLDTGFAPANWKLADVDALLAACTAEYEKEKIAA
ncbi:hypothetical protein EN932_10420 [Mesorhizobium sp. M7A.F.Ca.US.002.01.1.1]|uniref:hypothetical protein n=1 Tax=Mesorhizobium sp. M7A.F.Ca.US.002.01.1.1 TaxID=2496700 RepID=UPI000FD2E3BE|nr:hypothetical protein [Mesorhizobium sp. M7A.F.Ca.US.002.01.1.1]RVA12951.1 hypothetical protein EN932_10420 [Mesorhizobium sp. M7A.F.Ca.US.002.01.1.1]